MNMERLRSCSIAAALPEDALRALTTCRFCDERRYTDFPLDVFGSLKSADGPVAGQWTFFFDTSEQLKQEIANEHSCKPTSLSNR